MINASGNLITTAVIDQDALEVFSSSIHSLVYDEDSKFEVDRLFGERAGIGDPFAMIAVGLDSRDIPDLICVMPVEVRGRVATLGSYFPTSTGISVARFTVLRSLEYLANSKDDIFSVTTRAAQSIRAPYQVNGFDEDPSMNRLYITSSKLRSHAS